MKPVVVLGVVGVATAVLLLWIALRPADLTAEQTARALQRGSPHWRDVRCVDGDHGWDYTCGYTYSVDAREVRGTIGVDVDSKSTTRITAP